MKPARYFTLPVLALGFVLSTSAQQNSTKVNVSSVATCVSTGDQRQPVAEFFGTFWLVFGGCGAAVLAAGFPTVGIGFLGVALAFGLTVLTMAFAIGHISGCHLNPAISAGLVVGKRSPVSDLLPYVVAQVLGAIAAAGVLYVIASGQARFDVNNGFASHG
jgi:aquaporin Z